MKRYRGRAVFPSPTLPSLGDFQCDCTRRHYVNHHGTSACKPWLGSCRELHEILLTLDRCSARGQCAGLTTGTGNNQQKPKERDGGGLVGGTGCHTDFKGASSNSELPGTLLKPAVVFCFPQPTLNAYSRMVDLRFILIPSASTLLKW